VFERYTEKARRVVFFARYEASHYGSPCIETEHLLLGLLREDKSLSLRFLPSGAGEKIRGAIDAHVPKRKMIPTHVDLPLAEDSKRVLTAAAHEADDLGHEHIGTEHLLLGLLGEEQSFATDLLRKYGPPLEHLKKQLRQSPAPPFRQITTARYDPRSFGYPARRLPADKPTVRIHDAEWNLEFIRLQVERCREISWQWRKTTWRPRDIVVSKSDGRVSFDQALTEDPNFQLVKNGWHHDLCAICRWKLCQSFEPEHTIGYTNGRDWVCTECYDKFLHGPDYFASAYPEIT
jgi:hypothetical protein